MKIGVIDMAYIMDSGQMGVYTTFPIFFHKNRPYRPIYRNIEKIVFRKKKTLFFESKIEARGVKTGPIAKPRKSQARIDILYKPIKLDF